MHYESSMGQGDQGVGKWHQLKRGNIPLCYSTLLAIHQYQCCLYYNSSLHCFKFVDKINWSAETKKIPCKYRCALIFSIRDFEESTGIVQKGAFESKFYIQIVEILDGFLNMPFTAWGVSSREQWLDSSLLSYFLVTSDWIKNTSCETFED